MRPASWRPPARRRSALSGPRQLHPRLEDEQTLEGRRAGRAHRERPLRHAHVAIAERSQRPQIAAPRWVPLPGAETISCAAACSRPRAHGDCGVRGRPGRRAAGPARALTGDRRTPVRSVAQAVQASGPTFISRRPLPYGRTPTPLAVLNQISVDLGARSPSSSAARCASAIVGPTGAALAPASRLVARRDWLGGLRPPSRWASTCLSRADLQGPAGRTLADRTFEKPP
jgi:hypothetical protein